MTVVRWFSLEEAREGLKLLNNSNKTTGSIHTLGALHEGHGKLITLSSQENDNTIVTIYPNIAQLPPGSSYIYDVEKDCEFAIAHGATHLITPSTQDMYPDSYCTFFDQGEQYRRLDGAITPYLFRGMITMSTRWLIFTRPTRTYWGLKDIAQVILVKRAVKDLLIDTSVREVPCVRYKSGMAISSRMMNKPEAVIKEFNRAYYALEAARKSMMNGVRSTDELINIMRDIINETTLQHFKLQYIKITDPNGFSEPDTIEVPAIFQIVMALGDRNWFEGFYLRTEKELNEGPETIWLDAMYPDFSDS